MKKVLLLCGGNSPEHSVSLMSAQSILENIDKNVFETTCCIINFDNCWYEFLDNINCIQNWHNKEIRLVTNIIDYSKSFDIVFPITHGNNGEDGKLQGMLDLFNIKYVGCNTLSSAVGMDKHFSKILFKALNIPQVPFLTIKKNDFNLDDITTTISFPMMVKPANGGSSIGINKANNKRQLKKAIKTAFKFDKKVIIEKYVEARELECAVLAGKELIISEIGEIKSANEFYDYDAKYKNYKSYTLIPKDLEPDVCRQIKEYSKKAFIGIEAKDFARIDFFFDEQNKKVYLNEINTIPGFTQISMYPQLLQNSGLSYTDLITQLLTNS